MTYLQALKTSKQVLESPTAQLDAEVLLCQVLGKDRAWLHAHDDEELSTHMQKQFDTLIRRRATGEPVAYILGWKEFYGREFTVNTNVLVPRPESESFIELLKAMKADPDFHGFLHQALDMGTGSGCLAITIKLEFPDMLVTATDTSKPALKIAIANALAHDASVIFKEQSLLSGDKTGYDVVLANLPYVPEAIHDRSILSEPAEALFSGTDGLDHYRELFSQLTPKHIRFVMTESLLTQHAAMIALAEKAGYTLTKTDGLVQLFTKATS
jgi:release factor glutamine methyltransferase